ncbi:MAG TPA: hypothetical protein VNW90_17120 [Acetobacteraceae bacterium]|nr:hypothetical protein [Acetobacteraceae bacterium]
MTRVALTGGAYSARSVIAAAQRQVNLYSEPMPAAQGEPAQAALYPTPGLTLQATAPTGPIRGGLTASNGVAYVAGGPWIYAIGAGWTFTPVFPLSGGINTPVGMADDGIYLVVTDGTSRAGVITLGTNSINTLAAPPFAGSDFVDYLDTFFIFNLPGTPQFFISNSLTVALDPLDFANKEAAADNLVRAVVAKREVWLIGEKATEVWYNTGATDIGAGSFPFSSMPGVFVDRGTIAKYSIAEIDNAVYWLSQDRRGKGIVVKGSGYQVERISTFAMEAELTRYPTLRDAMGMTCQIAGHQFYILTFPSADKTWCFDISTSRPGDPRWHELVWLDSNGAEHRHRAGCAFTAFDAVIIGDWQNGNLYTLDLENGTDNGAPIKRSRAFPHLIEDGKRVTYWQFLADMEAGAGGGTTAAPFTVFLDWSDDRGHTFGNPVGQALFAAGEYRTSMQWQRLGMARDRVFRLTWSVNVPHTALQGAWIEAQPAQS